MQRDSRRHTTNGREVENNPGEDKLEGVAVPEPTGLSPQSVPGDSPQWDGGEIRPVTNHFELQEDDEDDEDLEDDLILGDEDELDDEDADEVADVEFDDELDEDDIDEDDLVIDADDEEDEDLV